MTQNRARFKRKLPTWRSFKPSIVLVILIFLALGGTTFSAVLYAQETQTQLSEDPKMAAEQIKTALAKKQYAETIQLCEEAQRQQLKVPLLNMYLKMAREKQAEEALNPPKTPARPRSTPATTPTPTPTPAVTQTPAFTPLPRPIEVPAGIGPRLREFMESPFALGAALGTVGFIGVLFIVLIRRKKKRAAARAVAEEPDEEDDSLAEAGLTEEFADSSYQTAFEEEPTQAISSARSAAMEAEHTIQLGDSEELQGSTGQFFAGMAPDEMLTGRDKVDKLEIESQPQHVEEVADGSDARLSINLAGHDSDGLDLDQLIRDVNADAADQGPPSLELPLEPDVVEQPVFGFSAMDAVTDHAEPPPVDDELPRSGLLDQTPQDQPPLELPKAKPVPVKKNPPVKPQTRRGQAQHPPAAPPAPALKPGLDDSFVGDKTAVNAMASQEALFQDQYIRGLRAMEKENWKDAVHYLGVSLALDATNEEVKERLKIAREKRRAGQEQ